MGIREYEHEYSHNYNVEEAQKASKEKNDQALDKLCKNICLIIGWSFVCVLFMYIIMMEFYRN